MTQRKKISTVVGLCVLLVGVLVGGVLLLNRGGPRGKPCPVETLPPYSSFSEFASMSEEKRWSRKTPLSAMLRSLPRGGLPVLLSTGWTANPGGESSGRGACQAV